jgi:Tetratricopeptide repeat
MRRVGIARVLRRALCVAEQQQQSVQPLAAARVYAAHGLATIATPPPGAGGAPSNSGGVARPPQPQTALPPVVDVTDQQLFSACVASSASTPLLLVVYSTEDAASQSTLTFLAQRASPALRVAVVAAEEFPEIVQALRVSRVPTLFAMHKQKVAATLVVSPGMGPAELAAFAQKAAALGSAASAETSAAQSDAAEMVAHGFKSLRAALDSKVVETRKQSATAAAQALSAALNGAEPGVLRAQALAGLSMAAALSGDGDTAKDLLAQAQSAMASAPPAAGSASLPAVPEVSAAEALLWLMDKMAAKEAPPEKEADAVPHAVYEKSITRFLGGDIQGGLDDALLLVRKHRDWRDCAGRTLTVHMISALGTDARGNSARRRLSSLWFA